MFENDDWNIDEDYLKDFNEENVSKDITNEEKQNINASSKNVGLQEKSYFNISQLELNNDMNEVDKKSKSENIDPIIQKNVIFDIFNKNDISCNTSIVSSVNYTQQSLLNSQISCEKRKNLVLSILQNSKNCSQDFSLNSKPVVKSVLKAVDVNLEHENRLKRKKHVAFNESINQIETNAAKKLCASGINQVQELHALQKEDSLNRNITSNKQISVSVQRNPKVLRIKKTVTRKFPGPAGLLPDDTDESEMIDLISLDENKNKKYADVCSQNTKNLFTTGAWQLMMDDIPADFELYDIATVKENALQYSKTYKRIPFVAGIIQYIDYKPNDPRIVIKDLSGKIDAYIHHSICKLYPNVLGINTVLFVKDVGIIVTSKKYVCMMISLRNLISIYSDEAKLIETDHLEQIKNNNCNGHFNNSQISVLEDNYELINRNTMKSEHFENTLNLHQISQEAELNTNNSQIDENKELNRVEENAASSTKQIKIVNDIIDVQEFDFKENNYWLDMNVEDLNSFKIDEVPSSTPLDMNELNYKNIVLKHKRSITSSTKKNNNIKTVNVGAEVLQNSNKSTVTNNEVNKIKDSKYKMKFSAFRSKHVLTPPTCSSDNNEERKEILVSNTKTLLNCCDTDTDDEILSQLDVDAIAANYAGLV